MLVDNNSQPVLKSEPAAAVSYPQLSPPSCEQRLQYYPQQAELDNSDQRHYIPSTTLAQHQLNPADYDFSYAANQSCLQSKPHNYAYDAFAQQQHHQRAILSSWDCLKQKNYTECIGPNSSMLPTTFDQHFYNMRGFPFVAHYPADLYNNLNNNLGTPPPQQVSPAASNLSGGSSNMGGTVPDVSSNYTASQPFSWMMKIGRNSSKEGKTRTADKYRQVYSDHQRLELEKEYHYGHYITVKRKAALSRALSLSERQIKIWFQNRRAKERKINKRSGRGDRDISMSPKPTDMLVTDQWQTPLNAQ